MPTWSTLLAFIPVVVAMQLVPGPDTLLVVGRGIGQGRRIALWSVFGAIAAGAVQLPVLALGAGALFRSSPLAFELLRHAGAVFLVFIGARLLLKSVAAPAAMTTPQASDCST